MLSGRIVKPIILILFLGIEAKNVHLLVLDIPYASIIYIKATLKLNFEPLI